MSRKLKARKSIHTLGGGRVDTGSLTQGEQYVVVLRISPEENRTNPVIVADLLPAGFEIETILKPRDGDRGSRNNGAFAWIGAIASGRVAQARDDQFVAAIDLRSDPRTLDYVVRAVTPGEFAIPGVPALSTIGRTTLAVIFILTNMSNFVNFNYRGKKKKYHVAGAGLESRAHGHLV